MLRVMILFIFLVMSTVSAYADDITTTIDKAKALYGQNKLAEAIQELNFAIGQIQNKQTDLYKIAFPAVLSGWTAEEFQTQSAGMAYMGGGNTISRRYNKGDASITISTVSDSPLMSAVMMGLSNPAYLGSNGRLVTVGGEKAVEEWSEAEKNGKIQIVLENRMLITIEGYSTTKADLNAYANKIDFAKLKAALKG